ncbi:PATL3 [Linum perenne]
MQGVDKEGHPVCYYVFGDFQDKELYSFFFSDEEKRKKFLRRRIQSLEKNIRKLDFSSTCINTIVQPFLLTTITIFNCFSASLSLQNSYITLSFSWRRRMEKEAEGERRRRDLIILSDLIFWSDWV